VDFWLADEQLAPRDTIRALCRQRFDLSNLATREGAAITSAAWQALAGVGVFGLIAPGEPGGAVEAVLAFEQLGAYLAPGPLRWTAITAPLMAGAANGSHRVTGIDCTVNDRAPYIVDHGRESDLVVIVRTDGVTVTAPTDLGEPIGTGLRSPVRRHARSMPRATTSGRSSTRSRRARRRSSATSSPSAPSACRDDRHDD